MQIEILFFCDHVLDYLGLIQDNLDIFLYFTHFVLYSLISSTNSLKIVLEYESHSIEKERDIKYSISHGQYLPSSSKWDKIAKSNRCRCNHGKIERIEVAISDRMPCFKVHNEKTSIYPRYEENKTYDNKFLMNNMEWKHTKKCFSYYRETFKETSEFSLLCSMDFLGFIGIQRGDQ